MGRPRRWAGYAARMIASISLIQLVSGFHLGQIWATISKIADLKRQIANQHRRSNRCVLGRCFVRNWPCAGADWLSSVMRSLTIGLCYRGRVLMRRTGHNRHLKADGCADATERAQRCPSAEAQSSTPPGSVCATDAYGSSWTDRAATELTTDSNAMAESKAGEHKRLQERKDG